MMTLILVSSNAKKLNEFRGFGLDLEIEAGRDLPEVDANPVTVAIHKAKAAGSGRLVEDTSLEVDGADLGTNIRWLLSTLPDHIGKRATWRVLLGANRNETIEVYEGVILGTIVDRPWPADAFGFDPLFLPNGSEMTLHELAQAGRKNDFSARLMAAQNFIQGQSILRKPISEISEWTGRWQNQG